MAVTSRATLTQYALRALSAPVVEINVDDSQLEDRIDEALDYWNQYHFDGAEKVYLKQKITASRITLTTSVAANFTLTEKVTGGTSGASGLGLSAAGTSGQVLVSGGANSPVWVNASSLTTGVATTAVSATNISGGSSVVKGSARLFTI